MARTTLTKTTALGAYPAVATPGVVVTMTASTGASGSNGNQFVANGKDLIIAQNTDGANPYTVTITGALDASGRVGTYTALTLTAGQIAVLGPFGLPGWQQSDGNFYLEANNAAIKFGIVALP